MAVALVATGCTKGPVVQSPTPVSPTALTTPSDSFSPAPDAQSSKHLETVIVLPDLGSVAWSCRGTPRTFMTAFTAVNATEKVAYALDGGSPVSKTLQPGARVSTPFTEATHHVWTVEQPIEPYDSTATITVVLKPDPVYGCFNPIVMVSRVRVSNAHP